MRNFISGIKKNIHRFLCVLAVSVLVSGCAAEKEIPEETVSATETTTENYEYLLVRGWTGSELLKSIFYCGEFHPLPLVPGENEGFSLSEGILTFPDGSFADAVIDKNGIIIALRFERNSAPQDLSVYGIDLSSRPDDIPDKLGMANSIYGNEEETITYSFYDGGIGELTLVYTNKLLVNVYIAAEV